MASICQLGHINYGEQVTRPGEGREWKGQRERPTPSPMHSQERCSDALRPGRLLNMHGRRLRGCVRGVHPRQGDNDSTSLRWDMGPADLRIPYARDTQP